MNKGENKQSEHLKLLGAKIALGEGTTIEEEKSSRYGQSARSNYMSARGKISTRLSTGRSQRADKRDAFDFAKNLEDLDESSTDSNSTDYGLQHAKTILEKRGKDSDSESKRDRSNSFGISEDESVNETNSIRENDARSQGGSEDLAQDAQVLDSKETHRSQEDSSLER